MISAENDFIPCDCPRPIAEGFTVAARLNGGLPELTGIITHPSIDPGSGRIIDRDGYDKSTGLLLRLNGEDWQAIPEKPSQDEIIKAVAAQLDPFSILSFCRTRGPWRLPGGDSYRYYPAFAGYRTAFYVHSTGTRDRKKLCYPSFWRRITGIKNPSMFPFGGIDDEEIRKAAAVPSSGPARGL